MASEPLCRYCFADGRVSAAEVLDHIVALSLGGSNDDTNLAPACQLCNEAKGKDERRFADRGFDHQDIARDPAMAKWLTLARLSSE